MQGKGGRALMAKGGHCPQYSESRSSYREGSVER